MNLFNFPTFSCTKVQDEYLLNKVVKKSAPVIGKSNMSLQERIARIKNSVEEHLGEYKEKYDCIREHTILGFYINECIKNGICAIDTETTGLNPMLDDVVGFSLYTPRTKSCIYSNKSYRLYNK